MWLLSAPISIKSVRLMTVGIQQLTPEATRCRHSLCQQERQLFPSFRTQFMKQWKTGRNIVKQFYMRILTVSLGAIEAGGTKFVCAVGTPAGDILHELRIPTTMPHETMSQVTEFMRIRGGQLVAIGI